MPRRNCPGATASTKSWECQRLSEEMEMPVTSLSISDSRMPGVRRGEVGDTPLPGCCWDWHNADTLITSYACCCPRVHRKVYQGKTTW